MLYQLDNPSAQAGRPASNLPEPLLTFSCLERGEGAHVWDPEGNEYLDFLAAYS